MSDKLDYKLYKMKELENNIKLIGRYSFSEQKLMLSWSASGFEADFFGEGFIINFDSSMNLVTPRYIIVTVDAVSQKHSVVLGNEKILIENLDDGKKHRMKVEIANEGGTFGIESIALYGSNPCFCEPPKEKSLKMEFIGDSITCGYASLAPKGRTEFFQHEEDVTKTYAYLVASHFDADFHIEAFSGQGIVRNCAAEKGIPFCEFYPLANRNSSEKWDFSKWIPDIIVINGGTNDVPGKVTREDMKKGATELLTTIRSNYKNAKIIWFYGLLNSDFSSLFEEIITGFNDKNMFYLKTDSGYNYEDEIRLGHPNIKCHKRAAQELIAKIESVIHI